MSIINKESIVNYLFIDGNCIIIENSSKDSFCSSLGQYVPLFNIERNDDDIYIIDVSIYNGNPISDKYVPLIISKFNSLSVDDFNIHIELEENELDDFCSFFNDEWNVRHIDNW